MRKTISLTLLLLFATITYAQQDTLKEQILNYENSTAEMIRKGRALIADKFVEGDLEKVAEVKKYLEENVEDPQYVVFNLVENWLLQYWTGDYKGLLQDIPALQPTNLQNNGYIFPPQDLLLNKLQKKSSDSLEQLKAAIKASNLSGVATDFLLLHLTYLFAGQQQESPQNLLNILADAYLENYPNSMYEDFVRDYIRLKFKPSKWGYGMNFFSGVSLLNGDLGRQFKNPVALGIAFDAYYQRWVATLNIHLAFSKTLEDIPYREGIWPQKSRALVAIPDLSVGYVALDKKWYKLAPFVGMGAAEIGATERDRNKNPSLDAAGYKITVMPVVGVSTDIKLKAAVNEFSAIYREQVYGILRLRYTFQMPQFRNRYDVSGNIHSITIGIGGFGRKLVRDR